MRRAALIGLLALAASGCASTDNHTFTDTPASKPFRSVVLIEHRMADEASVRGECYMRARAGGNRLYSGGPPGCSWTEGERKIVLCTKPASFNDRKKMEVCGHEAVHHHEGIDHL